MRPEQYAREKKMKAALRARGWKVGRTIALQPGDPFTIYTIAAAWRKEFNKYGRDDAP